MSRMPTLQQFARCAAIVLLASCVAGQVTSAQPVAGPPAARFIASLGDLCGKAFNGRIVTNEPAQPNDPFEGRPLVAHVRTCEPGRISIPLHVGDDRSRTWVITLHGERLRLKHDHRHQDGSEDVLTQYGGDSVAQGTATRQEFPVDEFSKALFTREGRTVSNTNTWALEVHPGRMLAYELTRPGRTFRLEFDLTAPVPPPPAPWGHK